MIRQAEVDDAGNDLVRVRVHGTTGSIILDRAAKHNALTRQMISQVIQALADLHLERRVRTVILTGAGNSFSSGTDLAEIRDTLDSPDSQQMWFQDCMLQKDLIEACLRFPKPILAAVNGPALGMGASLVLAADLAIGGENACFGFPEPQWGLVPGLAIPLLTFRCGAATVADLVFRPEPITGAECLRLGIYRSVVKPDLVWAKAAEIAQAIALQSPDALAMCKRLLNETVGETLFTQLTTGAAHTATARTTESAREGIHAFLEKRSPEW